MKISNHIDNLICPDCSSQDDEHGLTYKNSQIFCSNCKRNFIFDNGIIDLLPSRPQKISNNVKRVFSDYYKKQFKISANASFRDASAWGEIKDLSKGYQLYLKVEQELIYKNYSIDRNIFCDLSGSQGYFSLNASKHFKTVFFCDINLEYLHYAKKLFKGNGITNVIFIRLDYLQLPFKSKTLDTVLSTDSLIYYGYESDKKVIQSAKSKLKSGGKFIFDLHSKKFYAPAKRIFEYSKMNIQELKQTFKNLNVLPLGRVPTILHPTKLLFDITSYLFFLPPVRYLCILGGENTQIMGGSYYNLSNYDTQDRWMSYWHQIDEIFSFAPKSLLVVGVGNGIVDRYVKNHNISVTTFDLDSDLRPDIVGDVSTYNFKNKFDVILCAEVLEHLEFKYFEKSLKNLHNATKDHLILSLPSHGLNMSFSLRLPFQKYINLFIKVPIPFYVLPTSEHFWELGWKNFPVSRIRERINSVGFLIEREYTVPEMPYHRMFILKKI